jgi:hypothetical protein
MFAGEIQGCTIAGKSERERLLDNDGQIRFEEGL